MQPMHREDLPLFDGAYCAYAKIISIGELPGAFIGRALEICYIEIRLFM